MLKIPHKGMILGLIILTIGLLILTIFYPYKINTEVINLKLSSSSNLINNNKTSTPQIVGRLYIPANTPAPYPTMILWHGVSSSKEMTEPLAIELANHGIAALTFDSGGFGESYRRNFSAEANIEDAHIAFQYVKQHPKLFDQKRLGIGGHSMGAATAITFASYTIDASQIRVTLDLGMSAEVAPTIPPNLLMGIGLYEEFHTPSLMREMLQEATKEEAPQVGQIYGNFANGTARKLVISATSDHLMEPFDGTLIQEAVQWSRQCFGLPPIPIHLSVPWLMKGWFMTLIGGILTAGYGVKYLTVQLHPQYQNRYLVSFIITSITAVILLLGIGHYIPARLATSLILIQAVILPVSNYGMQQSHHLTRTFRSCSLYVVVIIAAYTTMGVLLAFSEILNEPSNLLGLPQFLLEIPIALVYSRVQEFNASMFAVYSNGLVPNWQLALLFLPELIYPSITLTWGTKIFRWVIQWLRQPLKLNLEQRPSARSLYLLGGLSVILVIVLGQQLSLGIGSMEHVTTALRILWQMLLAPVLLMILIIRSKYFQEIESKL
jgi:acetyl esterase/lipase